MIHISKSLRALIKENRNKSRVAAILNRICYRNSVNSGYPVELQKPNRLLNPELIGDYFTFREQQGMISYMPAGKEQIINDDGTWARQGRQAIKPGRWARAMIHPRVIKLLRLKDSELSDIATAVKLAEQAAQMTFELIPPAKAYERKWFVDGIDSCMWDSPVGPFYDACGAQALVCVNHQGVYRARAIVWFNVKPGNITFMDRIYADSPEVVEGMKQYAMSQGWYHKESQCRGEADVVAPDGTSESRELTVRCRDLDEISFYPYLDTLYYATDSWVSNWQGESRYTLTYTDGSREEQEDDHDGEVCTVDGDWISDEDAICVGEDWYSSNDRRICWVEEDDEYNLRENCVRVGNDWYRDDSDSIVSLHDGEYALAEEAVLIGDEYYHVDDDDVVCVDGEYYLTSDDKIVEVDGKWYRRDSDELVVVDDEYYHRDSKDIVLTLNDVYALKEDCTEFRGEWYLTSEMHEEQGRMVPDGWEDPDQTVIEEVVK